MQRDDYAAHRQREHERVGGDGVGREIVRGDRDRHIGYGCRERQQREHPDTDQCPPTHHPSPYPHGS
jgi:hypothetical protein